MLQAISLLLIIATSCITSAPPPENGGPPHPVNDRGNLVKSSNDFGIIMLRLFSDQENTVLSPLSLSAALAMLYSGSDGVTKDELASVLQYKANDVVDDQISLRYRQLLNVLNRRNPGYSVSVANAAYIQNGLPVRQDYVKTLRNNYNADVRLADFTSNSESVTNDINQWVNSKTGGNIPKLLETPLSPSTILALLNAVYFKGLWETKFDPKDTNQYEFYNHGTDRVLVDTMFTKGNFRFVYVNKIDCDAIEIPYHGNEASMLVVLPREKTGLNEALAKIRLDTIIQKMSSVKSSTIDLYLPKFQVESTLDLLVPLQQAGLKTAFDPAVANFSGIIDGAGLALSKALQKAKITVDEKGTVASAATVLTVTRIGGSHFTVNHPFLFFIVHSRTWTVLFSGKVVQL